ncbi:hypothetical protein LguiB_030476 [Lonicera macranthoides]
MFIQSYDVKLNKSPHLCALFLPGSTCVELQRKLIKSERMPMVTSVNQLKRQARLEKHKRLTVKEVTLTPPENGLLVLIVQFTHNPLRKVSIFLCGEVHVGHRPHKIKTCNVAGSPKSKEHVWERGGLEHVLPVVESFHLYDRIGRAIMRDGQHAWQEATIDDLVPLVYVWHVQDPQHHPEPLVDGLRRYYRKLPAVTELFAQAEVRAGDGYSEVMREDIAVPELNEKKLVVRNYNS